MKCQASKADGTPCARPASELNDAGARWTCWQHSEAAIAWREHVTEMSGQLAKLRDLEHRTKSQLHHATVMWARDGAELQGPMVGALRELALQYIEIEDATRRKRMDFSRRMRKEA